MKLSNSILIILFVVGFGGLAGSNYVIKKEYNRIDKSDPYWTYKMVENRPFKHMVVNGGNITNFFFEESPQTFVKIMNSWRGSHDGSVKTHVVHDTLYIDFDNKFVDVYEKYWLRDVVPVRISAPGLTTITGHNTKLVMERFARPQLKIDFSGDSKLQVNCFRIHFSDIEVKQRDSSLVAFTVSRELLTIDSIKVDHVIADLSGTSLLNLKSARIDSLQLKVTDAASIALTGYTLDQWR